MDFGKDGNWIIVLCVIMKRIMYCYCEYKQEWKFEVYEIMLIS